MRRRISLTVSGIRSSPSACGGLGWWAVCLGAQHGEQGVGEHRQGDVPVPAGVGADLVLVQTGFALAGLEGFLDPPPPAGNSDQLGQGGGGRAGADAIGQLPLSVLRQISSHADQPGVSGAASATQAQS